MRKRADRDMPIGKLVQIDDFLPPPAVVVNALAAFTGIRRRSLPMRRKKAVAQSPAKGQKGSGLEL
ncbi:MAG: hypothetical protein HY747_10950 [Elusimicrobia bacterium]|nr:hypothetical protein [Elusimicrobiota bacterium]